jgi:hypothetical protein
MKLWQGTCRVAGDFVKWAPSVKMVDQRRLFRKPSGTLIAPQLRSQNLFSVWFNNPFASSGMIELNEEEAEMATDAIWNP